MVFDFQDLASGKAEKKLAQTFSRAGANVVQSAVGALKRSSGVSFKDVSLTFADGQVVAMSIKQTGDIYAVKLNGKPLPVKAQDDHFKAIKEIVDAMNAGRTKFQAALAKAQAALPKGIKSAAPKMEVALQQKAADLDAAIADARAKVEELRKELGDGVLDSVGENPAHEATETPEQEAIEEITGEEDEDSGEVSEEQARLFDNA